MTDQLPPLPPLPHDDSDQQTTPHQAQRTAPMRPVTTPEAAPNTPARTPPVSDATPPPTGTRAMPPVSAQSQVTRPMPPAQAPQARPPQAAQGTRPMPPAPPAARPASPAATAQGQPRRSAPPATLYDRRRAAAPLTPRDSSLYLPWWSLALMLIGVLVLSFLVVLGIAALGGSAIPASRDPIIVIVTAVPTMPGQTSSNPAAPAGSQVLMGQNPPATLPLNGPSLPPVQFTPTPPRIAAGSIVIATNDDGLNVRDNPGTTTNVLSTVQNGMMFRVLEGPRQIDFMNWWYVETIDQTLKGWVFEGFISLVGSQGQ